LFEEETFRRFVVMKILGRVAETIAAAFLASAAWIVAGRSGITSVETPVLSACSPDRSYCASLVMRESNSKANASDIYVLRIKDVRNVLAWSHWADFGKGERVLLTTEAHASRLDWRGSKRLEVICQDCKMNYGDVWDEVNKSGPVEISYNGFVEPLK
jgi:hypothetical protein